MVFHKIPDPEAQKKLKRFLKTTSSINWTTTSAKRVYDIKNESLVGKPVKIAGHIHSISDPRPIEIMGKRVSYVQMSIKDRSNDQIAVLPVYDRELQKKLKDSFLQQQHCTFRGTVLSIITKDRSEFVYYLHDFRPTVTAEDLIEVQYEMKTNRADIFIKEIGSQKDKFKYFKNKIVDGLKIKGLDTATELSHALDFMIYQAFSSGMYNNNSMKLHSLDIS